MKKSLIIGLDGADYHMISDNIDSLPNLRNFISGGTWGKLESTIPPATTAAWTTALSGMGPGKSSITDFKGRKNEFSGSDDKEGGIVNAEDVCVPRCWDILNATEANTAVIGVPLTYPVDKNSDIMISGFLAPEEGKRAHHPQEILNAMPEEYQYFIHYDTYSPTESGKRELLGEIYESTNAKFNLLKSILSGDVDGFTGKPDHVCFILSELDWIQHYLLLPPTDENSSEAKAKVIEYLAHIDSHLGDIIDIAGGRNIGILSDHGFGKSAKYEFYVNNWLQKEGYLIKQKQSDSSVSPLINTYLNKMRIIASKSTILKNYIPNNIKRTVTGNLKLTEDKIDWDKTIAVCHRSGVENAGYIDVNKKALDPDEVHDIIQSIVKELDQLTTPTGENLFQTITPATEYYEGKYVDSEFIPDIVFIFNESVRGREALIQGSIIKTLSPSTRPKPTHRMSGFYVINGKAINSGCKIDTDIHNFMPTFYSSLDIPLPTDMDGEVVEEALKDVNVNYNDYTITKQLGDKNNDLSAVEERLDSLGYM